MNCHDYQRLLHLNRTGEFSAQEAEDLRRHLRLCEKCTLEYQRIQRAEGFADRLTSFTPSPNDPGQLTAAILRRIREESSASQRTHLLSSVADFFPPPAIRYATAVIILLIVSTFMAQLIATLKSVSDLEKQMALVSGQTRITPQSTYTAESKTLQEVAKSKGVKSLSGILSATMKNGHIEISASELESIAPVYALRAISTTIGTSALHIDRKTLEKIINEVNASVAITLRFDREGK